MALASSALVQGRSRKARVLMDICDCGKPKREHHPSLHYAQERDRLMKKIDKFLNKVYPADIFGNTFTRGAVSCAAACYILDNRERS